MKKIFSMALAVVMVMSLGFAIPAEATVADKMEISAEQQEYIKDYVCDQVVQSYSDYYVIPSISAEILSTVTDDPNVISVKVLVSFTKVLKAESAYDLPYIQGLQAGIADLTNPDEIASAEAYLNLWVNELEGLYIGKEQMETAEFCVELSREAAMTYSLNNSAISIYYFDTLSEKALSMDAFQPETEDHLYASGVLDAQEMVSFSDVTAPMSMTRAPSSPTDYDRVAARDYARKWVCGRTDCGHSCYNNDEYDDQRGSGGDCANYVSKCIRAGGIKTEPGVWEPYVRQWNTVSFTGRYDGICEYMVNSGYFFDAGTNKTKAFAGSIISWLDYGHVGLVDQNDTVKLTYCAHTTDELSTSFEYLSRVKFYVPVWDSYAGCYTPQ